MKDSKNIYKKCRKVKYSIYCCKVPVGSVVLNKLFDIELIKENKGKVFFTPKDMSYARRKNTRLYKELKESQIVHSNEFVTCGICGELSIISLEELKKNYITEDGLIVDEELIINNCFVKVGKRKVNILEYMESLDTDRNKLKALRDSYSDWFKVRYNGRENLCAIHIPYNRQVGIANIKGVNHGRGDFVVYKLRQNGEPIISSREVVNGIVFKSHYNKRGWCDCIDNKGNRQRLNKPKNLY